MKVVSYECFVCGDPAVRRYEVFDLPQRQKIEAGTAELLPVRRDSLDVCKVHADQVRFAGTSSFIVVEGDA